MSGLGATGVTGPAPPQAPKPHSVWNAAGFKKGPAAAFRGHETNESLADGLDGSEDANVLPFQKPQANADNVLSAKQAPEATKKPPAIPPNFANIPAELTTIDNWVMWKFMRPKTNGQKWRKVPFQPNGETASTTDRSTWTSFQECCAAYARSGFDGIGFVFDGVIGRDGLCYAGIDFDACIEDRKLQPLAKSRIKALKTYTELSVSGTGAHCITRAKPLTAKSDGVEIYSTARFFVFTGADIAQHKIRAADKETRALAEEVRTAAKSKQLKQKPNTGLIPGLKNGPAAAFTGHGTDESLSDGIKNKSWFDALSPELKDEVVDHAFGLVAKNTPFCELGGDNDKYLLLALSAARSGAPNAENLFVKYALRAEKADPEAEIRHFFTNRAANERPDGSPSYNVGNLINLALQHGADFDKWKRQTVSNPVLEQMNRDFAAGFIGSKFRVARFDQHPQFPLQRYVDFLSQDDFIKGVRHPMVQMPKFDRSGKPDGTKMEPRGAYWLGLSDRSEYDAVTFQPGAPSIIELERTGRIHRTINTYSGFSVVPDPLDSAAKCSLYLAHTHDNIAGGDETLYKYILDWMASGVQHPDNPGRSSLSMRGPPGCGKGVFALGYGRLFGRHFLHATNRDHVIGKFNAHQAETCLIFVDEALYAEIAADAQILKTMTSETTKLLERKGIDAIQIANFARQIFATNAEHPIQIEHDDRRYPALYVQENKAFANETDKITKAEKRKAYFTLIIDELNNGGSEALLGFLLDRDIRGFNAEAIPETSERHQQILKSAPVGDQLIIEFAQDGCLPTALRDRPWIARSRPDQDIPRKDQTPGLYEVMRDSWRDETRTHE